MGRFFQFAVAVTICAVRAFPQALDVQVSTETAPAGGTAQFKISLAKPLALIDGRVVMEFDPTVFGEVISVNVLSATGDVLGAAKVQGRRFDVRFRSIGGGVGRLPDLPVLTVVVPVLPGVTRGTRVPVTFNTGSTLWKDADGNDYSVTVKPGQFTAAGELSIRNVTPGGGVLPAGTVVAVEGTGFMPTTRVEMDGAGISSVRIIGAERIELTLSAPTEMTGKRIIASNSDTQRVEHVCSLRSVPVGTSSAAYLTGIRPIFPLQGYRNATVVEAFAVQNPNVTAVDLTVRIIAPFGTLGNRETVVGEIAVALPAGGEYLRTGTELTSWPPPFSVVVTASEPIRMLNLVGRDADTVTGVPVTPFEPVEPTVSPPFVTPLSLSFDGQAGIGPPAPQGIAVCSNQPLAVSVSAETTSGGQWLLVTPALARSVVMRNPLLCGPPFNTLLTVSVETTGLTPGLYHGTITLTLLDPSLKPIVVAVSLSVTAKPALKANPASLRFFAESEATSGRSISFGSRVEITSSGNPIDFEVTLSADAESWLIVDSHLGTTPATLYVQVRTGNRRAGDYSGVVTLRGAEATLTIPVQVSVSDLRFDITPNPPTLTLSAQRGGATPKPQILGVGPAHNPLSFSASTESGGSWLDARPGAGFGVEVSANPAGLSDGTYRGTITLNSMRATKPATVPVTLIVWSGPPPALRVSPASLSFTVDRASGQGQTLRVETGPIPVEFAASASTAGNWMLVETPEPLGNVFLTPKTLSVGAGAASLLPGSYRGQVTITAASGSVEVPVTLRILGKITSRPFGPPLIGAVVNAASQARGAVAPNEIITIYGFPLGPLEAVARDSVLVLFDGEPAQVLYASVNQVNAIVPREAAGRETTTIEVEYAGVRSAAWGVPVVAVAPSIFIPVLNEDGSPNGPTNAAARGSPVRIFATGVGVDPVPVTVTIGGVDAEVLSTVSPADGVLQVTAVVPLGVTPGPSVEMRLRVGRTRDEAGFAIAVK
ncbi:MAG: BACON domain-containing protein [Bryobacteraceae bacterium]